MHRFIVFLSSTLSHKTAGGSASSVHWAIYSRTWNWVWSPNRNPVFPLFPRLPLFNEILQILTRLL